MYPVSKILDAPCLSKLPVCPRAQRLAKQTAVQRGLWPSRSEVIDSQSRPLQFYSAILDILTSLIIFVKIQPRILKIRRNEEV